MLSTCCRRVPSISRMNAKIFVFFVFGAAAICFFLQKIEDDRKMMTSVMMHATRKRSGWSIEKVAKDSVAVVMFTNLDERMKFSNGGFFEMEKWIFPSEPNF